MNGKSVSGDKSPEEHSRRFRSPWLAQLDTSAPARPLLADTGTDVAIVGAGIAGLATAFFVLRDTSDKVLLIERTRAGHGASGRNAGQLVTYFERPLCELADAFGVDMATRAQAEIEAAWPLLDQILRETGTPIQVERFVGAMGLFTLNHLLVHLRNRQIRRQAGLMDEVIEISEEAPFLDSIPHGFRPHYDIVPQAVIRSRLGIADDSYVAVLMNRKGCGNSALICQELLRYLEATYPDRFAYADHTSVDRIVLERGRAVLKAGEISVFARRVVLCTNGFSHHTIENRDGQAIDETMTTPIRRVVGYMAGFTSPDPMPAGATSYINNTEIGGTLPYYYATRRPYERAGLPLTLTALGGPETTLGEGEEYDPDGDVPAGVVEEFDTRVRPVAAPERPAGLGYDYTWHGLMAYTPNKVRIVGSEPRNPVLFYNLGCNGVGFLPSLAGGKRVARLLAGQVLEPSIFDPA